MTIHTVQVCNTLHSCFVTATEDTEKTDFIRGGLLAIVDTACTKTVAWHSWFECCCDMCDALGFEVKTYDHEELFKFGASRVYASRFGVSAWFAVNGKWFLMQVAIVSCKVPLLFSRPAWTQAYRRLAVSADWVG